MFRLQLALIAERCTDGSASPDPLKSAALVPSKMEREVGQAVDGFQLRLRVAGFHVYCCHKKPNPDCALLWSNFISTVLHASATELPLQGSPRWVVRSLLSS